jgi:hypothetical protein
MPGRLRTGSKPLSTSIDEASYLLLMVVLLIIPNLQLSSKIAVILPLKIRLGRVGQTLSKNWRVAQNGFVSPLFHHQKTLDHDSGI